MSTAAPTSTKSEAAITPISTPSLDATTSTALSAAVGMEADINRMKELTVAASSFISFITANPATSDSSTAPASSSSISPISPALFLYATVTGQSEDIAKELLVHWDAALPTVPCEIMSTEQFMKHPENMDYLPQVRLLVFVISTTGNGEEPDMARKFLRELRKRGRGFLKQTKAVILALGDSNYSQFCEAGVKLKKLLVTAGVTEVIPMTKLDEVTMESDVKSFMDTFDKKVLRNQELIGEAAYQHQQAHSGCSCHVYHRVSALVAAQRKSKAELEEKKEPIAPAKKPTVTITPVAAAAPTPDKHEEQKEPTIQPIVAAPIHVSASFPVLKSEPTPATAAVGPKKKSAEKNQLEWLDTDVVPSSATATVTPSTDLPSYYLHRWGNLDAQTERASLGTEAESPAFVTLHSARYLTTPECHAAGRMVVHMELELPRGGHHAFTYKPGDSIGIYCANDSALVMELFQRLKVANPHRQFSHGHLHDPKWSHLPVPCSLLDAFMYGLDITASKTWKKGFLVTLAEACTDPKEKVELYGIAGRDADGKLVKAVRGVKSAYDTEIMVHAPTLLDLLERFPSCQPSIESLILELPPLLPRSYSLSSSQVHDARIMSIAWSRVEYRSEKYPRRQRYGVCTKWMHQLCQTAGLLKSDHPEPPVSPSLLGALRHTKEGKFQIPVFRKHSSFFALPEDTARMVTDSNGMVRPQSVPNGLHALMTPEATTTAAIPTTSTPSSTLLPLQTEESRLRRPLIMIGPGTGVAPFRGFLQQRLVKKRALESHTSCEGEWRTMDHLATPTTTIATEPKKGLQPPMSNREGVIKSKCAPTTTAAPLAAPKPVPVAAPKALGHYGSDIVFDDSTVEWDERYGGPVTATTSTTALSNAATTSSSTTPIGPMYLYFGCRRSDWDYLYAHDFAHFVDEGVLAQFSVAFSRESTTDSSATIPSAPSGPPSKYYVQHRLRADGAHVVDLLLNHHAYLYVCGDGVRMANDVTACIKELLQTHGGKTPVEADALVQEWKSRQGKEPTYIEDIWT